MTRRLLSFRFVLSVAILALAALAGSWAVQPEKRGGVTGADQAPAATQSPTATPAPTPAALTASVVTPAGFQDLDGDGEDDREDEKESEYERAKESWNGRPLPGTDLPGEALKFRLLSQRDENGVIPIDGLVKGKEHVDEMMAAAAARDQRDQPDVESIAGISRSTWTAVGPGNIGGRVRSIAIHPTTPATMFAGSVGGGIWKTIDTGASWAPVDDFLANIAVSTIIFDPANPAVMYAGTGEGFYNADGLRGAGIFKSTNGGTTWTQLAATNNSSFHYVNRLTGNIAGNTILAATRSGIFRTQNFGTSWTNTSATEALDVDFNPNDSTKAVASGNSHNAWYTIDTGATWIAATGLPATGGRVEIAYAPSSPNIVYASIHLNGGTIYKSVDGGATYALVSAPAIQYLGNQGWYDNALWVNPVDPNVIIVGGVDLYKSTDGGVTISRISRWQASPSSAHADHHVIVSPPGFDNGANKTVFFGNDGGIYKATDWSTVGASGAFGGGTHCEAVSPFNCSTGWTSLNNNLAITQFYGGAGHAGTGRLLGGTQDNGTLVYNGTPGIWATEFGGDGGWVAIDPTNANTLYGEYVYAQVHRSLSGSSSGADYITGLYWTGSQYNCKLAPYNIGDVCTAGAAPASSLAQANFIAPFILDPNVPTRLLVGARSLWRTNDATTANTTVVGPSWTSIKSPTAGNSNISAVAVALGNSDRVWVGHNNGDVYMTTNGTAGSPTWTQMDNGGTPLPNRFVQRVTVDPNNPNIVYATFGGYSAGNLWRSTDNGTTWADISGSGGTALPSVPVRDLDVLPTNSLWLYAATELGVFASADNGATWGPATISPTDGPANVSVDELFFLDNTTLVAATHGRGMFKTTVTSNPGTLSGTVTDSGSAPLSGVAITLSPGGASATTNGSGFYTMSVPAGTYTVSAAKAGYGTGSVSGVVVPPGGTTTQNFQLGLAATISGQVLNASNSAPITNATLTFNPGGSTASTDGSGNYTKSVGAGTYTVTAAAPGFVSSTTSSFAVGFGGSATKNFSLAVDPNLTAVYDATLKAPKCTAIGVSCDSGPSLLLGRGAVGPEPNAPNTINNFCADGNSGSFHGDESNDRIKVATLDNSPFAPGKTVQITATVYAYPSGFASDALDLYYAANAASPVWTLVTTLVPTGGATQILTATYTLPAGALQAVRAVFRFGGAQSSCSTGSYDDNDDLIFAVNTPQPLAQSQGPNLGTQSIGPMQFALNASGGTAPYVWSVIAGSLPPGIALRTDVPSFFQVGTTAGLIGVATTPGTYNFTLRVVSGAETVDQAVTLKISNFINKEFSAPEAFVGVPYSYQLSVLNNSNTPVWTSPLSLPPGITLSSGGLLSGTPTAAGFYSPFFTISDTVDVLTRNVSLNVYGVNIPTPGALPDATQNVAYSTTITAAGGSGGYTFTAGQLPSGLSINSSTGVISGTTSSVGKFNINVTAKDSSNVQYTKLMSLTVIGAPAMLPAVNPYSGSFDDCTFGFQCILSVAVMNGGTSPFTWVASGLPPGMSMRFAGMFRTSPGDAELWGAPYQLGTFPVTLTVTDGSGNSATNTFTVKVSPMWQANGLANGTQETAYSQSLRVIGGTGTYTGAQTAGLLPAGVFLNSSTLAVSGTPTESGFFSPRWLFTDSGSQTLRATSFFSINGVGQPVTINTNSDLGSTMTSQSYSRTLAACGPPSCGGTVTWSHVGGSLPTGVTLSAGGSLSGTPSVSGVFTFLIKATDAANAGNYASRQFTLNVTPINITTSSLLPIGNVGTAYSQTLAATGGTGALTWTLMPFNYLPPGVTLNSSTGALTGTPTAQGQYVFTVRVDDTASHYATRQFNLTVLPAGGTPAVVISNGSNFGTWSIGQIQTSLTATGGNGTYAWSIVAGALPPGIYIRTDKPSFFPGSASAGLIGVATTPGTYTFTLRVTSGAQTADLASTIKVTALRVRENQSLPDAFVGNAYSYTLSAVGNAGAVTWSPGDIAFPVPPGMTLGSGGVLSGTPTGAFNGSFSMSITDGTDTINIGQSFKAYAVKITTPGVLPSATSSVAYSASVAASGGTAPYTFNASGLPNGLSMNSAGSITGTTTQTGKFSVNVTANATSGGSYSKTMSLMVMTASASLPSIGPYGQNGLDDCTIGMVCSRTIAVFSGTPPFTWTATGLPTGMAIRSGDGVTSPFIQPGDAEIWGSANSTGTFNVQATVTDNTGATATNTFVLKVSPLAQTNSLQNGTLGLAYSSQLRVIGGSNSYTIAQTGGSLPGGLGINTSTFLANGTPSESGQFSQRITYTDSASQTLSAVNGFNISSAGSGTINIGTSSDLGSTTTGSSYSRTFSASGAGSITWTPIAGAFPSGMTFNGGTGVFSGTPTVSGVYNFLLKAADTSNAANYAQRQFTLNVTPINISTNSNLPFGNVGTAYSQTLAATGGSGALTWSVLPNNYLPPGVTLSSAGVLSGTPTSTGTYSFNVKVVDSASQTVSKTFFVGIFPAGGSPAVAHGQGPNFGTWPIGQLEAQLVATGGTGTYSWSVVAGSLPPGLAIRTDKPSFFSGSASAGLIGVATTPGTYNFTLRVTSGAQTADQASTIKIVALTSKENQTPDAFVGTPFSYQLNALGNLAGVSWTLSGSMPPGLSLSSSGLVSGTPTTAGNYNFSFNLTDGTNTIFWTVSVNISAVQITTPGMLPNATQNTAYSTTLNATGGSGGYTFTLNSSLPSGLSMTSGGVISGTVTSGPGKFDVDVTVKDSSNVSYYKRLSVTVIGTPPTLPYIRPYGSTGLDDCTIGVGCNRGLGVYNGGTAPFTWTATGLPPGMTLRSGSGSTSNWVAAGDVELWGRPSAVGTYNVQFTVTDFNGTTATNTFPVKVSTMMQTHYMPNGTLGSAYTPATLRVLGGSATYNVAVTGGALAAGLTVNGSTLQASGTPTESGNFSTRFTFTDSASQTLSLTNGYFINGAGSNGVNINTGADLGSVLTGSSYSRTLSACCAGGITWSHVGGALPTGVTLSSGGLLSGTPTVAGVYTFLIKAADTANASNFAWRQFTLNVTTINITTGSTLPFGNVGTAYSQTLAATGGSGALTWSLMPFNYLPPGITLSSGGVLSGTPSVTGQFVFTIKVTDTASAFTTRTFNLTILPAGGSAPVFHSQGPNFGTWSVGQLEQQLVATGGDGVNYTWSIVAGALPPGVVIRTDPPSCCFSASAKAGLIGVATTPGTYNFTLRVTSGASFTDQAATLKVVTLGPKESQLPDAFVGTPISIQLSTVGQAGAVTWTPNGTLPAGITLSASGLLSGTPTTAGNANVGFGINDGTDTVNSGVSFNVYAVNITSPGILPNATQNSAYSTTITATGGSGGYTFTASGLPSGLSISSGGVISGTPTNAGKSNGTITAKDSSNVSFSKNVSITVIGVPPTLPTVTPYGSTGLDDCTLGVRCSQGVAVFNGGVPPYSWNATGLPPGMSFRTGAGTTVYWITPGDLELWGRPTAAGTYNVQVTVTDGNGATATNTFPLKVSTLLQTSSAQNGTLGTAYSRQLRVIGGTGSYTVAQTGGLSAAGLTLSGGALTLSGTPTESGFFGPRLTFTDSASQTLSLKNYYTINGAGSGGVNINTGWDLGYVTTGTSYSRTLSACCGSITWTLVGGAFPAGLTFNGATGVLSGTPTTPGVYTFLLKAADSANAANFAQRQFTLSVTALNITTNSLPFGNVGTPYSQTLAATGGTGPLTWTVAPFNFLPPGISLSSAGAFTGTPTTTGNYLFTVSVNDAGGPPASRTYTLPIYPAGGAPPVLQLQGPNFGTRSIGLIEQSLSASGGTGTYTWSIIAGSLPTGLALRTDNPSSFPSSASAGLVGVATTPGTYNFTLRVSSGGVNTDLASTMKITGLTIKDVSLVNGGSINASLPDAFAGNAYSYTFTALGNAGAVTWSATGVPAGMSLSSAGVLSGTPTAVANTNVTLTVTDGIDTISRTFSFNAYAIRISTPGVMPNATQGAAYSQTITASGGTGPYTFSVTSGGLPGGLSMTSAGVVSGTPTGFGPSGFSVTATDSASLSYQKAMLIDVIGVPAQLPAISLGAYFGRNLEDCIIGMYCSRGIGVFNGGTAPYTWTTTGLPPGMSIRSGSGVTANRAQVGAGGFGTTIKVGDAEIWGVPTASGNYSVQFTVTDANGVTASNTLPLKVTTLLQPSSLTNGIMGTAYSSTIRVIGGTLPYSVVEVPVTTFPVGAWPAGLALNTGTFVVSGTPIENGTFNRVLRFTDAASQTAQVTNFVNINTTGSGISINTGGDLGVTTTNSSYSRTLTASGAASITWSQIGGSLPPGITLSSGGVLSGTPTTSGFYTFLIKAADATNAAVFGQRQFILQVSPMVISTTSPLAYGNVGTAYSQTFASSGGTGTVTWTFSGLLPPGLTLSSAGVLSGTPTAAGQTSFTIVASDTAGRSAAKSFTLSIYPVGGFPPLFLGTGPNFGPLTVGRFVQALNASGGVPPYQYSLAPGAPVIPGLRVQNGQPLPTSFGLGFAGGGYIGVITTPGTYTTTLRVTDAASQTFDRAITITVAGHNIVSQTTVPKATLNVPYSFQPVAYPAGGTYTWSATNLPAGVSINSSTGLISGTPTTFGSFSPNVTLTDVTASKSISIGHSLTVDQTAITPGAVLPQGTIGTPYNVTIGGPSCGGCVWTSTSSFPTGLSLSPNGIISGTPQSSFTGSLLVSLNSGGIPFAQKRFGLVIANPGPALQVTTASPLSTTVGGSNTTTLFASGGTPPYATWSVQSGSLPPGITIQGPGENMGPNLTPGMFYLAGRPMAVGTYNFTIAVTDAASVTATKAITWNISALTNEYSSLPNSGTTLVANSPYSQQLLPLGGTPPYAWSATGTMPSGLTLSGAGLVSGTPTVAGVPNTAILLTDAAAANSFAGNITFTIDGARISGTVTNAATTAVIPNAFVEIYNGANTFVTSAVTDASGNYTTGTLATGTYYAKTANLAGFTDQVYSNTTCAGCNPTTGTPIPVTSPTTTTGINFALVAGGRISGAVTNAATTAGIGSVGVRIYNSTGGLVTSAPTDASGNYVSPAGLPTGTYFARTVNVQGFVNRLWNNIECLDPACTPTAGTAISVTSPSTTGGINFALGLPGVPAITSISPSSVGTGGPAFTLTVNGTGFVTSSVVRVDGVARTTTLVSGTQLTAAIPASDIASGTSRAITVTTPAPGGGTSNSVNLTLSGPSITAASTLVGVGQTLTFTVANGPGNVGDWVAVYCPATLLDTDTYFAWKYLNNTQTAPTTALTGATLTFTAPASPTTCNARFFANNTLTKLATSQTVTIDAVNSVPTLTALTPSTVPVGSTAFTLTLTGTNFVSSSVVSVNASPRTTTFVSPSQLTVPITATDVAIQGANLSITVFSPAPGGGTSNPLTLTVGPPNPVPAITTITPNTAQVGGAPLTLTVNGSNFVSTSVVSLNASPRTTTYVSPTQLTAAIPATDLLLAGAKPIQVVNPAPGGGPSNIVTLLVSGPTVTPTATTVAPGGTLTFTVANGPGNRFDWIALFCPATGGDFPYVDWKYLSNSQTPPVSGLTAATITFTAPATPGETCNARLFANNTSVKLATSATVTVTNPVPALTSIAPNTVPAGSAAFTLTVTGSNFVSTSVVSVNASPRTTTFVSPTQLTVPIAASDVVTQGANLTILVSTPAPGGGPSSPLVLTVGPPNPVPAVTLIAPASVAMNAPAFTLTVTGSNFVATSVVQVGLSPRPTTFVSGTQLTAVIPASDLTAAGARAITVFNPSPGGGTSDPPLTLTVTGPTVTPTATSVAVGSTLTFTVASGPGNRFDWIAFYCPATGGDFPYVDWKYLSNSQTAPVSGLTGASITFTAPASGTTCNARLFLDNSFTKLATSATVTVNNPVPAISNVSPSSIGLGGPAFTLTVTGSNFVTTSVVQVNGSPRPTTFVSATQVTATIPASDLTTAGTRAITVSNPAPGGGTSDPPVTLTVVAPTVTPTATTVAPGGTLTFTVANGPGNRFDWIALFCPATGGDFPYVEWKYLSNTQTPPVSGLTSATITFTAPATPGETCNARLFANNASVKLATSATVTVTNPVPALTSIAPNTVPAGSAAFTLTVTGSNFVSTSVVSVNASPRTTTFVSPTQLTVPIAASDVVTQGANLSILVSTPAPGGGPSSPLVLTVGPPNPVPAVTLIAPASVAMNAPAFTLTVTGSNFVATSVVQVGLSPRPTTFVSGTQLTAVIPASDLTAAGARAITVFNPSPGGGTSDPPLTLTVTGPTVTPTATSVAVGSPLTFTVASGPGNRFDWIAFYCPATGGDFPYVDWKYLSNSQTAPVSGLTGASITFTAPAAGTTCNARLFLDNSFTKLATSATVTVNNPVPAITNVSPNSLGMGGPAFTLTVTGSNFVTTSVVQVNGSPRPTTFVSATQVTAAIPATDLTSAGTRAITVFNPAPGGGTSNPPATLTVVAPVPAALTSPTPGSTLTGASATFQWTTGTGVAEYWLYIGTTGAGSSNVLNASQGTDVSRLVTGLPTNGGTVFVRLWSRLPSGWVSNDYTLTAATLVPAKAVMTTPTPGSTLTASTVTFQWTTGAGVSQYWLYIGTSGVGSAELYSASEGLGVSRTVSGLPINGTPVFVRLWSFIAGAWQFNDYTYTAATLVPTRAAMTSPTPGSTLTGSTVTFQWDAGVAVAQYWLYVGTAGAGSSNLYNASEGTGQSRMVTGLPTNGSTVFVTLWSFVSGAWQFNQYTYTSANTFVMMNPDGPAPIAVPAPAEATEAKY